jgi:hypothetical protein
VKTVFSNMNQLMEEDSSFHPHDVFGFSGNEGGGPIEESLIPSQALNEGVVVPDRLVDVDGVWFQPHFYPEATVHPGQSTWALPSLVHWNHIDGIGKSIWVFGFELFDSESDKLKGVM